MSAGLILENVSKTFVEKKAVKVKLSTKSRH